LSDRSQQQQLQHADSHVCSCHLHREVHWRLEESAIRLTTNLIK
jgi:hypothetical protein